MKKFRDFNFLFFLRMFLPKGETGKDANKLKHLRPFLEKIKIRSRIENEIHRSNSKETLAYFLNKL